MPGSAALPSLRLSAPHELFQTPPLSAQGHVAVRWRPGHPRAFPSALSQVLEGRKPTGGKLEVKVRLREPLSGQEVQTVTENWLVLEPRGL